MSNINIFYYFLVFGHLKLSIEPYTPFVHLPDDDKNYVPNRKFKRRDLPADYGPKTPITRMFYSSSYSKI